MMGDLRVGPQAKRNDRTWNARFGACFTLGKHNLQALLACVKAQGCLTFRFTFTGDSLILEKIPRDRVSALLDLFSNTGPKTPGTVSGLLEITRLGGYSIEVKKCDPAAQTAVKRYITEMGYAA